MVVQCKMHMSEQIDVTMVPHIWSHQYRRMPYMYHPFSHYFSNESRVYSMDVHQLAMVEVQVYQYNLP